MWEFFLDLYYLADIESYFLAFYIQRFQLLDEVCLN